MQHKYEGAQAIVYVRNGTAIRRLKKKEKINGDLEKRKPLQNLSLPT